MLDPPHQASGRIVLVQVQQRMVSNAVEPHAAARIAIAVAHRDQANWNNVSGAEMQTRDDDLTGCKNRARP